MNYKLIFLSTLLIPFTIFSLDSTIDTSIQTENIEQIENSSVIQSAAILKERAAKINKASVSAAGATSSFIALIGMHLVASREIPNKKISLIVLTIGAIAAGTSSLMANSISSRLLEASEKMIAENKDLTAEEIELINKDINLKDQIAEIGIGIAALAMGVFCVKELYYLAKDTTSYFFPTKEQIASALEAHKECEILEAKKTFRDCLIKCLKDKSGYEINASGRPTMCEQAAQMLESLGGKNEAVELTENFQYLHKPLIIT